ncbi:MAG: hypothetical protein NWR73_04450 [Flavobacteriales bacterium]|nr:hypothetical protein [Flavobacteriales bacterium]
MVLSDPYSFSAEVCLGNPDLNWDGFVNAGDLIDLLGPLQTSCNCQADITGDGFVDSADLLLFVQYMGLPAPGCSN